MADEPDLTDEELAAMAAAALLAVRKQRDRTHDEAAAALAAVLAALAAGITVASLAAVIDPDASRDAQRAAVAAELARQADVLGVGSTWAQVVRDAHTAATTAGFAAAAHVLSAGHIPVEPEPSPFPNPFDPAPWVRAQQGGLAGDIVDVVRSAIADAAADEPDLLNPDVPGLLDLAQIGITDAELADLIDKGAGALYYLDVQVSDTYIGATTALYLELGMVSLWWNTMGDSRVCSTCEDYEARSPYAPAELPDVPHGGCRCWVTPE